MNKQVVMGDSSVFQIVAKGLRVLFSHRHRRDEVIPFAQLPEAREWNSDDGPRLPLDESIKALWEASALQRVTSGQEVDDGGD